jgi:hypothetical protein
MLTSRPRRALATAELLDQDSERYALSSGS